MKPNFALDITDGSVGLLHRTPHGWTAIGEARFDGPDLNAAVGDLLITALRLSPHGITTKLILPDSQVLYCEVEAPGPGKAERRAQIAQELEGRTPYDVADLVFDWCGEGPVVQVAVVPRDTLVEAEAFANGHRLNPISFATTPPAGRFATEPWFGPTALAASLLPAGEQVTRDHDPVAQADSATSRSGSPATGLEAVDAEAEARRLKAEGDAVRAARAEARAKDDAEEEARRQAQANRVRAEADAASTAESDRVSAQMEATSAALADDDARKASSGTGSASPGGNQTEAPPAFSTRRREDITASGAAAAPVPKVVAAPPPLTTGGGTATDRGNDAATARPADGSTETKAAPAPSGETGARNAPALGAASGGAAKASAPAVAPRVGNFASRRGSRDIDDGFSGIVGSAGGTAAGSTRAASSTGGKRPVAPRTVASPRVQIKPASVPGDTDPPKPVAARPKLRPFARSGTDSPTTVRNSDTTMGSFGKRLEAPRGKPPFLGLILTVVLLLVLGLVAAWSSLYFARNDTAQTTELAANSAPDASDAGNPVAQSGAPTQSDAIDPELTADIAAAGIDAANDPGLDAGNSDYVPDLSGDPVTASDPATAGRAVPPDPATAPSLDVAGGPSATPDTVSQPLLPPNPPTADAARVPQPDPSEQDEIFLATTDAPNPAPVAAALPPSPPQTDAVPQEATPPPAFGTEYQLDADGRIIPGKVAIMTPEGVRLIQARPKPEPPTRPETPAASVAAPGPPTAPSANLAPTDSAAPASSNADLAPSPATSTSAATPPLRFSTDPGVSQRRPVTRPADADPGPRSAADSTTAETVRLSALRPKLRPVAMFASAEAARQTSDAAAASLAANAAAASAIAQVASASLVATIPRRPAARPDDFSGAVQAAVASASRRSTPAANSAPAASDTAQAEADNEPEIVASAAPRIPTRANVAKQATFTNAINLSETNLIGVYGTSSNRYALVRNSSGRFSKVKVGDRLDGGRVAAITASDLRYQKGNRMLVLSMPKG